MGQHRATLGHPDGTHKHNEIPNPRERWRIYKSTARRRGRPSEKDFVGSGDWEVGGQNKENNGKNKKIEQIN